MPTTLKSEDDSYYYFESLVPGFSNFAITGAAIVVPVAVNETQQMVQAASTTPTTVNTSGGWPSGFASSFGFMQSDNFAFAVIIISVLAMIIVFARAKTKSGPRKPQSPQQPYSYQGRYLKTKPQPQTQPQSKKIKVRATPPDFGF
jgi:hypothetical protein